VALAWSNELDRTVAVLVVVPLYEFMHPLASLLIRKTCLAEGVQQDQLVLHSDNGSPMKGATMLATLQKLGVVPSFSRPSVSDDNPYSESLFRTLKYTPSYPAKPFQNIEAARK
jgi:putative transposase